jgi:hypothetical protein
VFVSVPVFVVATDWLAVFVSVPVFVVATD